MATSAEVRYCITEQLIELLKAEVPTSVVKAVKVPDDDEDEAAMERHYNLLQKELQSKVPDKKIVTELMDKEFKRRQQKIMEFSAANRIKETLKLYPCLKWKEELMLELCRIVQIDRDKMVKNWQAQCAKLKAYIKNNGGLSDAQNAENITGADVLMSLSELFPTKLPRALAKGKTQGKGFLVVVEDSIEQAESGQLSPYLLCHRDGEEEEFISIMVMEKGNTVLYI